MATEAAVQVHDTLPRVLKVSALYYKSKNLQHAQLQESSVEKI